MQGAGWWGRGRQASRTYRWAPGLNSGWTGHMPSHPVPFYKLPPVLGCFSDPTVPGTHHEQLTSPVEHMHIDITLDTSEDILGYILM